MKRLLGKSCLILVLSLLSVSVAWGSSHGAHSLTIKVTATGEGKVYLSTSATAPSDNMYVPEIEEMVINCGGQSNKDIGSCSNSTNKAGSRYAFAKLNKDYGYYFAGWYQGNTLKSSDIPYNITWSKQATEENKVDTYEARFLPVSPTGAAGDLTIAPQSLTGVESHTVVFTTEGRNNLNDFEIALITGTLGDGSWSVDWSKTTIADNKVTLTYTYQANRTTYKNSEGTRTDEAELTLTSKSGKAHTATIKATFPSPAIQAATAQNLNLANTSSTASGVATFPVSFADAKSDFRAPVFVSTAGAAASAWTVMQWDYADNQVTVHYTFRGDGANRNNSATLTLTSADGTASNSCTVTATVPASQVLSATADNLSPVLPETEYRGTAVFEVQYAATHAVSFGTQQGAGTWKVLNSVYKVTDEAAGKGTVTVNYSYTTAADFAVRQNSNTLTLTLDGGAVSRSCAITANVPDAAVLSATAENLSPLLPSTEYKGTAVFEVQYAAAHAVSFGEQQGAGTWKVLSSTYRITDAATGKGIVTVEYSYTTAADYTARTNSNTLTLTLDGGASRSCIITANLPAIAVTLQSNDVLVMTLPEQTQAGKVVFAVTYADGVADFVLPTATDSRWSITDMQYASLSPSSGTLTVNYTFDNGGVEGDWTTDLTLQTASGATCVATLRAIAEKASDKDAAVTTPAGETTEYDWAEALLAANSEDGCTLRLLRNVALETLAANQEIKRNMTLDLNGKTLSATLPNTNISRLLWLNTAGVTLTVKDGRSGGTLKAQGDVAGALYAVQVNKGNLIWESGNIEITNTTGTGNNWNHATGIYLANGTGLTMTGGTITSRHTLAAYAGGIYAEAGAEVTATGVTIDVQAHSNAYGIYANAAVSAEGVAAYARLSLTDNTVAVTTLTTTGAYGVYLQAAQRTVTTGDHIGEYAAASNAVITGGSYTATAKTSTAYGIYAVAPVVTANGNAYAASELTVSNATVVAKAEGGSTVYAIHGSGATTVTDCEIVATAPKGYAVRGLFLNSGKAVVSGSTIKAEGTAPNNQTNGIYAIYANASISNGQNLFVDLTAENNTVTATATTGGNVYGVYLHTAQSTPTSGTFAGNEYAVASNAVITGGSCTATAKTTIAYGICAATPVATAAGGAYAAGELTVTDATIVARTLGTTTAYGIQGSGATTVERCHITAEAKTTTARGISLQDKTAKITDCEITATGTSTIYGIYANASISNGRKLFVDLVATNTTVSATATTGSNASAVYMMQAQSVITSGNFAGSYATASRATIIGGTYTAEAKQYYALAITNISNHNGDISVTADGKLVAADYASLKIKGATIKAKNINANYTAMGVSFMGDLDIDDCTIEAEVLNEQITRGVMVGYGNAVIRNSKISAKGKTSVAGIYANAKIINGRELYANLTLIDNIVTATTTTAGTAYGVYLHAIQETPASGTFAGNEYAAVSNAVITGGSYTATAATGTAYGICAATPVATAAGGAYAAGELTVTDATIVARTLGTTTAYGIQGSGATTVERCHITAEAKTTTARGISLQDKTAKITDCEITATGTTTVHGIYANASVLNGHTLYVDLTAENNTVTATAISTAANNDVYGMYLNAAASLPVSGVFAGNEYAAASKAVITGGTYTATAARNNAYAVSSAVRAVSECGGAIAYPEIIINGGTFKAVTNTTTARALNSGGKAIVNGGVFTAQAGSSSAMGFLVSAGTLEATDAVLNISATTSEAYGVYLDANINAICAVPYATQATLNNLQMTVTSGTSSAYGVCGKNGTAIAQTDATFETWCKNTKQIMNADGTIKEGYEEIYKIYNAGYKRGEFADMVRSLTVNGGTYNITAGTATAHGIFVPNTYVSTNKAVVIPEMSVQDAIVHVKASTGGTVYGIQSGGPTTVTGCDISATAPNGATVRGVFLQNGEATVANSVIVAEGCKNDVFGIYADAVVNGTNGYATFVDLTSDNNTVTATSLHGSNAYGLYLKTALTLIEKGTYIGTESAAASSAVIKAGSYTADANSGAYGIMSSTRAVSACGGAEAWPELIVNGATVSATTDSLNTAYALQSGGKAIVDGGRFTARTAGTAAYGFYVTAGNLVATGATITATAGKGDAEGIYLTTGIADICMAPQNTSAELNNLNVTVRTLTGNSAYGIRIYDNGTSKNQTDASFETWCKNTKKIMDADGNITNQALYDIYNAGYKRGEFVEAVHNVIVNGGTYDIISNGTTAYGVKTMTAPVVSATGKTFAATGLTMRNAIVSATTETGATAYGVYTSGPTSIETCDISATSATTGVQGIHIYDNKTVLSNSTVSVNAAGNDVYGVYAYAQVTGAGWQYKAELESDNTVINAETVTGSGGYAVWLHAHATQATTDTYGRLGNDYAVAASAVLNGGTCKIVSQGDVIKDGNGNINGPVVYGLGFQAEAVKNDAVAAPSCIVNGGKYWGESKAENKFADVQSTALRGNVLINDGYFRNSTNVTPYIREGYALVDLPATTREYEEGYRYFIAPASASGTYVCEVVGQQQYKTLEEALQFVNLNPNTAYTIRMLANYTLPAGDYVLPAKATLLIPYKTDQTSVSTVPKRYPANRVPSYVCRKLTFEEGVNLTVLGKIEVSGEQYTGSPYSAPAGPHGQLCLQKNARIDLESEACLYAWGYITGQGLIDAKDGAKIYELFQLPDFHGGAQSYAIYKDKNKKVFLISHYCYQNIEASVVYHKGAKAYGSAAVYISGNEIPVDNRCLVGEDTDSEALFKILAADDNTWIKKEYDPLTDRTEWTVSGETTLSNLAINIKVSVKSINMNSADYVVPVASNMTINVVSGALNVAENAYLMPGTVVNIAKDAKMKIASNKNLYLIDTDDWVGYKSYNTENKTFGAPTYVYAATYSPTWQNPTSSPHKVFASDKTNLPDAKIFVNGTIEVEGSLYTSTNGANICSTNGAAGKVVFKKDATTAGTFYHLEYGGGSGLNGEVNLLQIPMNHAYLHNADGTYTKTANTLSGQSYNYIDGVWQMQTEDGCLSVVRNSSGDHYYAQPNEIVEVTPHATNYTYEEVGGTRIFIYTEKNTSVAGCAWWEVEKATEGIYRANQPQYDNYGVCYQYDNAKGFWVPMTVTVTWNIDNSSTQYTIPAYTSPVWLGATPVKNGYAWKGWTTPDGTFYNRNASLPPATSAITYTAVFEADIMKYTVTFANDKLHGGAIIKSILYNVNERPVCSVSPQCPPTPTLTYTFSEKWTDEEGIEYTSSELPVVTAPAVYYAVYNEATRYYTVTFANYDGTVLYTEDFAYGTVPAYRGSTPVRENNMAYSYTFSGWDKPFGTVLGAITYTAQFTAKEREYGEVLDIVDWTDQGPVLNMNGYTSPSAKADWTVTADGIDYSKTDRLSNRTLKLSLQQDYAADDEVLIQAKGTDGVVESRRRYKVPHVFDADAVLGAVAADYSSVLFVRAGKLTVTGDATVAAVYVAPGAELCINAGVTLAAGKLVLRTEAFASAVFTNNGTLLCDNVCYSRIVSDNSQAYPLALPFDADLSKVTFSNGKTASFGAHFGLLAFDTQQRADKGDLNGGNWVGVNPAETTKLNACQGYQLLSASGYWSEYRFPVTYTPDGADAALPVKVAEGTAHKGHWGWNAFCSPYTSRFVCLPVSPEEAVKICLPNTDNRTYRQEVAATLEPASLFFHQAFADGTLSFGADAFAFVTAQPSVVARQMPAVAGSEQTQWIRLFCGNNTGMQDETTVYLHPDKFSMDYQTGYDVIKLSKQGTLPFVWSALPYGDMAFAALPDSVAERGIALAVFAPTAEEMYFSLEENDWLMRLEHLWLLDKEEQMQTDLLENDYSWLASAGVSRGRFFLYPVLRNAPDNNTGWNELHTDDFVAYAMGKTIVVEHLATGRVLRCYDTTGQLITCLNTDAEQLSIEVPTDGMYFVQVDNGVKKVMVK
ncbi:MAG: hypothetical protein ACI3Z5_03960 [Paludibacteraceae bacterium]